MLETNRSSHLRLVPVYLDKAQLSVNGVGAHQTSNHLPKPHI